MIHRIFLSLILAVLIAALFGCTEHVTEDQPVAIGNKLNTTPQILRGLNWTQQFTIAHGVAGRSYNWQAIYTNRDPEGSFDIDSTGLFEFAPALGDSDRQFGFRIVLSDGSGIVDNYDFAVAVMRDAPLVLAIERTHNTLQGLTEYVSIRKMHGSQPIGRIECSIVFDSIALQFESVEMGSGIAAGGCNWDRIEYSLEALPDGSRDSLYMLNMTAIADNPKMAGGPSCVTLPDGAEIFLIKLKVSNGQRYECTMLPLRFVWTGCRQNAVYSPSGDTAYVPGEVNDFEWDGDLGDHSHRLTGIDCDSSYGYALGGDCDKFIRDCAPLTEVRNLVLANGGIGTACIDSIDVPHGLCVWDFNVGWEFPEYARYTAMMQFIQEYILQGASALEGITNYCISRTDVNQDKVPLTVADLVYAERIIVGDALPFVQLAPYSSSATFEYQNRSVSVASGDSLAAVALTFIADSSVSVVNNSSLTMLTAYHDGERRILLYSGLDNLANFIPPGEHELVTVSGDAILSEVAVSDYSGNMLLALYNKK